MNEADDTSELDQRDYGIQYKARGSSSVVLKVEGGMLAIAIALVALGGVIVGAITLPILAQKASAASDVRATYAEREARIAQDKITYIQSELSKKGIYVELNDH